MTDVIIVAIRLELDVNVAFCHEYSDMGGVRDRERPKVYSATVQSRCGNRRQVKISTDVYPSAVLPPFPHPRSHPYIHIQVFYGFADAAQHTGYQRRKCRI